MNELRNRFSWTAEAGFAFSVLASVLLWAAFCKHVIGGHIGAFCFAMGVLGGLILGCFWALGARRFP